VQDLVRLTKPDTGLHNKENTGTAGVNQIHNPWARVPLQILDAIGSGFAPGLTSAIPGTQLHHQALIGGRENALKQDEVQRESQEKAQTAAATQGHLGAQAANLEEHTNELDPAQAREADARAWSLLNPQDKEGGAAHTIDTDQGIMQWNPATKRYDIRAGGVLGKKEGGSIHQDDEGNFIIAYPDGTAKRVTIEGQPVKGKAQTTGESTDVKNYQFAKEQGYAGNFEQWQRDEANRKMVRPAAETGTWSLQEDKNGKPVLMNSKTGEMKAAPEGLQPRGTAAKDQPTKDAITYAETYLKGGRFTGPGDEALMDQFFAAAKPKRMNAQQNELLMHSRDLVQGARAQAKHFLTPNAPYFDDEQRAAIVETMRALAGSQGIEGGGAVGAGKVRSQQNSKGEFRYSTDDGKTWQSGKPPQ
jgi:hypothetical protein